MSITGSVDFQGISKIYQPLISKIGTNGVKNLLTIIFLNEVYFSAEALGEKLSALTGGRLEFDRLIPRCIRKVIRQEGGTAISFLNRKICKATMWLFGGNADTIKLLFSGPVAEELMLRLPLLLTSWAINTFFSKGILGKPLIPVAHLTGAHLLKGFVTVFFSILFIYVHKKSANSGRAMGIFVCGLVLSAAALRSGLLGLAVAILAHSVHNMRA